MKTSLSVFLLCLVSALSARPALGQNHPSIRRIAAPDRHAAPTLSVRNDYRVTQYIFVDQTFLGTVTPSTERSFVVPTGSHLVIAADSQNPDDNPATERTSFRTGSQYFYRVFASTLPHKP